MYILLQLIFQQKCLFSTICVGANPYVPPFYFALFSHIVEYYGTARYSFLILTLVGLKYSIIVETGDVRGAGTDANVFVALSGSKGHTEKKKLESHPENFERGRKDEFTIKSESDLGMIETVHVSHDNTGPSPAWYIEKVTVIDSQHQNEYVFVCEQWLGRGFQNGCSITLQCASGGECANKPQITSLRSYMLELSTGAEPTSGTTADVYVILHGEKYSSEEQWLRECSDRSFSSSTSDTPTVSAPSFSPVTSNTPTVSVPSFSPVASDTLTVSAPSFSPDTTDTFTLSVPRKVHPVKKITVGHNCRGKSPAWFLKEVCTYEFCTVYAQIHVK